MYKSKVESINSFLLISFMFISSLTLPLKQLFNSGLPVWIATLVVITVSVYFNRFKINIRFFMIAIVSLIIFFINIMVVDYKNIIFLILFDFVKFGLIPLYLSSLKSDYKALLKYWYYLGIFNLIIWLYFLTDINSGNLDYMYFGVYMSYSFIIFSIYYYRNINKILNLILMLTTFIPILLFANRVSTLICIVFIFYFEIKKLKTKGIHQIIFKAMVFIIIIYIFIIKLETFILVVISFLNKFDINSYFFQKLLFTLDKGLISASSGRDGLYQQSFEIIKNSFFMPNGIGYFQHVTGEVYPHNIILDVLISFGFFGVVIAGIICYQCIRIYKNINNVYLKLIVASLLLFLIIRLNFSGTFWTEVPFWMTFGLLLFYKKE